MKETEQIQLQMNFRGEPEENLFRSQLYSAQFSILFEIPVPSADANLESAAARFAPVAEFAESCTEIPCSLAFTDADPEYRSYPMIEFASALVPNQRGKHVLYLSGRGRDQESVDGFFAQSRMEGFQNVVCVSGLTSGSRKNTRVYESMKMLQRNLNSREPLFAGAVTNPYKYEVCASLLQSFKFIKKARAGASFGVVQFGWDAAKLQETSWQMSWNSVPDNIRGSVFPETFRMPSAVKCSSQRLNSLLLNGGVFSCMLPVQNSWGTAESRSAESPQSQSPKLHIK